MPEQSCSLLLNHTAPQRRIAECKREHRQLYWTACARLSISSALTDIGESSQCRRVKAINLQKTQHFSGVKSTALIIDATGFLTSFKGRRVARLALIQVSVQVRRELFSTRRWFRRWLSLREASTKQLCSTCWINEACSVLCVMSKWVAFDSFIYFIPPSQCLSARTEFMR